MERLTKERAKTPAEISAKVAIAIDWLRCDGFEHTMAILNSVMVDLRMMELQTAAEGDAEEEQRRRRLTLTTSRTIGAGCGSPLTRRSLDGRMTEASTWIKINRTPVLTLWAAVVAERLGFDRPTALTLGQAVAGLSAYAKGVSLGIIEPRPELVRERGDQLAEGERLHVDLLGRAVPVVRTDDGLRAVSKGKPGNPAQIERYLAGKFGERLGDARQAMASWRQPMSRQTSTGSGSGCTSSSGQRCRLASRAGERRASWI